MQLVRVGAQVVEFLCRPVHVMLDDLSSAFVGFCLFELGSPVIPTVPVFALRYMCRVHILRLEVQKTRVLLVEKGFCTH